MNQAKGITEEDKIIQLLNDRQDQIFTQISNNVNNKLIKELQKTSNLEQPNQYSHIKFVNTIQQNQPIDRQQFDNKEVVNFPIYLQNYLDLNANTKIYYPKTQQKGLIETPKQFIDQTNVQSYLINQTKVYDFNQPEIKQIYPKNLVENMIPTHLEPDYLIKQESKFNFSSQINQNGRTNKYNRMYFKILINLAIGQSLKQKEQRLFLNTPEHSLLTGALQEKVNYIPSPFVSVPAPPPPDPFLINPQYRLYGIQQEAPLFNVQSYIPEKTQTQTSKLIGNSNIIQVQQENLFKSLQDIKLNFLDRARYERKEEKFVQ